MTIYEQIQKAIDFIEENLNTPINKAVVASEAGMCQRSFQDYFWKLTGLSYKAYLVKRRLSTSIYELVKTDLNILDIALDTGYKNHESFTRAFKKEFDVSPQSFRQNVVELNELEKIRLFKEKYMGVIIKELQELLVVTFEGYGSEPEDKAKEKRDAWVAKSPKNMKQRILGHNIDKEGNISFDPENEGYKFLVTIEDNRQSLGQKVEVLLPGKFAVTGIEGNFTDDPAGSWIGAGWGKMNDMIDKKGYKVKQPSRWFEEELEPETEGNLRLDLYLEIE